MDNFLEWTPEQIEDLINRVYGGIATRDNLPKDLHDALLAKFDEALVSGMSSKGLTEGLASKFKLNMKEFVFAKTFQQINDMSNFILDANGDQILFAEFKKSAMQIFNIYNGTWLETEFNTAKSITESAIRWEQIQENKDILPLLRYSTVGDGRVRKNHKKLDDIIRPVDDVFWDKNYPPNDFNCRCIVEELEEGEISDVSHIEDEEVNPVFRSNPAKTGKIFSEDSHPYFNGLGNKKSFDGV